MSDTPYFLQRRRTVALPFGGREVFVHHADIQQISSIREGHALIQVAGGIAMLVVKFTAATAVAFVAADFLGLPIADPWFDVLVVYVLGRWAMTSVVNGMPEPEVESSLWYIWCYRTMHSLAHISTAYFSHKNMWKYISGLRDGGE